MDSVFREPAERRHPSMTLIWICIRTSGLPRPSLCGRVLPIDDSLACALPALARIPQEARCTVRGLKSFRPKQNRPGSELELTPGLTCVQGALPP